MSVLATIHHGTLPLITSGPTPSRGARGTLDALTVEILTSRLNWERDADLLGYQYEQPVPGYHAMWVQTLDHEPETDTTATVRVQCIGLLSNGEKRQRRMSVAGRQVAIGPDEVVVLAWTNDEKGEETSGTPVAQVKRRVPKLDDEGEPIYKIITVPGGSGPRWNVREPILVVTDTYFTTSAPNMQVAGTAVAPPNPPTAPPYVWGGYIEPMRGNFPNGWVLDDRQTVEYFTNGGGGLWEITDVFGYYYIATPE